MIHFTIFDDKTTIIILMVLQCNIIPNEGTGVIPLSHINTAKSLFASIGYVNMFVGNDY